MSYTCINFNFYGFFRLIKAIYRKNIMMRKGRVLFNNTLNTFYLWLYGVGHFGKGPFR